MHAQPFVLLGRQKARDRLDLGLAEYHELLQTFAAQLTRTLPMVALEQGDSDAPVSENLDRRLKELAESASLLGADKFVALYSKCTERGRPVRQQCPALLQVLQELERSLLASMQGVLNSKAVCAPLSPSEGERDIMVVKTPEMTLRISGTAGSNPYWARVQTIISNQWESPPIAMLGQPYTVTVKFRLQRDGAINDVVVQQSSGNAYFDLAGQRAVLRPQVLPAFPAEMNDAYKDLEMVFRIGVPVA